MKLAIIMALLGLGRTSLIGLAVVIVAIGFLVLTPWVGRAIVIAAHQGRVNVRVGIGTGGTPADHPPPRDRRLGE